MESSTSSTRAAWSWVAAIATVACLVAYFEFGLNLISAGQEGIGRLKERFVGVSDTISLKQNGAELPEASSALRTSDGILRKVLLMDDAPLRRSPGGDPLPGEPRRFFDHLFVFGVNESGYEVGTNSQTPLGWVDASVAVEWDTRLGLQIIRDVDVFETADDAIRAVRGERGVRPFARGSTHAAASARPFPLVDSKTVQVNGKDVQLSRLLFVGHDSAKGSTSDHLKDTTVAVVDHRERAELSSVKLRVVADYTGSMQDAIDAAREQILQTAHFINDAFPNANINFSLLAYRDYEGSPWVTQWLLRGGSAADLRDALMRAVATGGGPYPEAMFDGIYEALAEPWSVSSRSQRLLLLVPQTYGHEDGPNNPRELTIEQLVAVANKDSVSIYGLQVPVTSGSRSFLCSKLSQQLSILARKTGGSVVELKHADEMRTVIDQAIKTSARTADVRVRVYDGIAQDKTIDEIARAEGLDRVEVRAAFEFIRESTNIFERRNRAGDADSRLAAHAAHGWIVSQIGNDTRASPYVLVSRGEISFLISELLQFASVAEEPERILQLVGGSSRVQIDGYFGRGGSESFAGFLSARGAYIHPDSLLFITKEELISLPEARRRQIRHRLDHHFIPSLTEHRNSDIWHNNGYGFIPQRSFP